MRHLMIMLTVMLVAGCATSNLSPSQEWDLAQSAYSATVESVTQLSRADLLDVDDLERFDKVRKQARGLLDQWRIDIEGGEAFPESLIERLDSLLERMQTFVEEQDNGNLTSHRYRTPTYLGGYGDSGTCIQGERRAA